MKKIFVAALTVALLAAFTLPASAFESEFGGYWRARAYTQKNFTGDTPSEARTDSRTRIYYTAKFSDNFKFVNKFEFDTVWGDNNTGDIGADGNGAERDGVDKGLEIKNSYVDFTTGNVNMKIGIQYGEIARGFMLGWDFSGIVATYDADDVSIPFFWVKVDEKENPSDVFSRESDYYALSPVFNVSDTLKVNPYFIFYKTEGIGEEMYYLGGDVDMQIAEASIWGTLIIGAGDSFKRDDNGAITGEKLDTFGYLVAAGANAGMLHTQFFIASGDDDSSDGDNNAFINTPGRSYYWSEIMGYGVFDDQITNNTPGDGISNVIALNVGVTMEPMEKLTLSADIWFAQLAEEIDINDSPSVTQREDQLGTEVDLKATYAVTDNLNLDLIAAYLFAGDVTGEDDPYEIGTRLSFSF